VDVPVPATPKRFTAAELQMQNTCMPLSKQSSGVTLAVDALIRIMSVDGSRKFSVLLGAGASISSGMPTAQRCIWEWKREIFITRNPTLKDSVGEISLQGTQRRIQQWLDQGREYPKEGSAEEYSAYVERCFPTQQSRRSFFAKYVKAAVPHTGYQLLAIFGAHNRVSTIWTTNFEGLAARACSALNVPIVEVGIDTQHRFTEAANADSFRVVSMHGDYRYDALKNTAEEPKDQERQIREALTEEITDDLVRACHTSSIRYIYDAVMAFSDQDAYRTANFLDFHVQWGADPPDPEQDGRDGFGGDLWKYAYLANTFDPVSGATGQSYPGRQHMLTHMNWWVSYYHLDGYRLDSVNNVDNYDFINQFRTPTAHW
jgi:NAD-dependent SIR2 family protein deacetylase